MNSIDEYFGLLLKEFPSLEDKMKDDFYESHHFKMELFAEYTNRQILIKELQELKKCFDFQESQIELMNTDLENALIVSYCESLLLGEASDQMKNIENLMPIKLKKRYLDYKIYYENLSNN